MSTTVPALGWYLWADSSITSSGIILDAKGSQDITAETFAVWNGGMDLVPFSTTASLGHLQ